MEAVVARERKMKQQVKDAHESSFRIETELKEISAQFELLEKFLKVMTATRQRMAKEHPDFRESHIQPLFEEAVTKLVNLIKSELVR